jgi:hypothetical protein
MRKLLIVAVLVMACNVSLIAQSNSGSSESGPGLAGDVSCRVYFAVIRAGKSANAIKPHGLSEDELHWWKQDGHKKAPGLCYLSSTTGQLPDVKAQCSQCPVDWQKSFYWFVMSSTEQGSSGPSEGGVPDTVRQRHRDGGTSPSDVPITTFPSSSPGSQSADLSLTITADIYSGFAADSPLNPQSVHLKVTKKRAFERASNHGYLAFEYLAVERDVIKESAKEVLKYRRH